METPEKPVVSVDAESNGSPALTTAPNDRARSPSDVKIEEKTENYNPKKRTYPYPITVFLQFLFLMKKNLILSLRRWKSTCFFTLGVPIGLMIVVLILKLIVEGTFDEDIYPNTLPITHLSGAPVIDVCRLTDGNMRSASSDACYEFVYTTNGQPFANEVMEHVIANVTPAAFQRGNAPSSSYSARYTSVASSADLKKFFENNPNKTLTAIEFFNVAYNSTNLLQPTVKYTLWYNTSSTVDSNTAPHWKKMLDNAILYTSRRKSGTAESANPQNPIEVEFRGYPRPQNPARDPVDIYTSNGGRFLAVAALLMFLGAMNSVIDEKEKGLRLYMEIVGLESFSFWLSWFCIYALYSFVATLATMVTGYATVAHPFIYSNPLTLFLVLFEFYIAMVLLGFLCSTFVPSSRIGLILGFVIIAFADTVNSTLSTNDTLYSMFSDNKLNWLLMFYAPFNYLKVFQDIALRTRMVFSTAERKFIRGPGFSVGDMFESYNAYGLTNIQPAYVSLIMMAVDCIIYGVLVWYFDNVFYHTRGPFFLLSPNYWGYGGLFGKKNITSDTDLLPEDELKALDEDLRAEYEDARNVDEDVAIRLTGVHKTFKKNFGLPLIGSKNPVLENINLAVKRGETVCLIAENNKGKSTVLNSIVALPGYAPSSGHIFVNNMNVQTQTDSVRKTLGICSQTDILWKDLTAGEHLQLFAELRGLSRKDVKHEIVRRLKQVDLLHERYAQSGTFSGGMKRRLSCAIAMIGSPQILILDECSTGMDPNSKREVWKMILELKKSNVTCLLTTHELVEAEALADRIAFLAPDPELVLKAAADEEEGKKFLAPSKVQCIGSALKLKRKYEGGYHLSLICQSTETVDECMDVVKNYISDVVILSCESGVVHYNVHHDKIEPLTKLLTKLEEMSSSEDSPLKDFTISMTTLEEVYVKVIHPSKARRQQERLLGAPAGDVEMDTITEKVVSFDEEDKKEESTVQPVEVKAVKRRGSTSSSSSSSSSRSSSNKVHPEQGERAGSGNLVVDTEEEDATLEDVTLSSPSHNNQ